ncbi:hypothetical protein Hdeb2414_s0003g00113331 [Helianthus debilis subsp. tardiflorus]
MSFATHIFFMSSVTKARVIVCIIRPHTLLVALELKSVTKGYQHFFVKSSISTIKFG